MSAEDRLSLGSSRLDGSVISENMVRRKLWWFFDHAFGEDGLGIHPILGDLDLSGNLKFLAMLKSTFFET